MEPAEKKQDEPVFRLQSSVRGEIEWLLMVCDSTSSLIPLLITELLKKLPRRAKILVACERHELAPHLLESVRLKRDVVWVKSAQDWSEERRCFIIAPPPGDPRNFGDWPRDPFHVFEEGDALRLVKYQPHKNDPQEPSDHHPNQLADFIVEQLSDMGFPKKQPAIGTEDWLKIVGGNLLCDEGFVIVEKADHDNTVGLQGEKAPQLRQFFGVSASDLFVVGGGQEPMMNLPAFSSWNQKSDNVEGLIDVTDYHIDMFLTLTGTYTNEPQPRYILFLAEVSDPFGVRADNERVGRFFKNLNAFCDGIERRLPASRFKIVRNKVPLLRLESGKVVLFPMNNCLVQVSSIGNFALLPRPSAVGAMSVLDKIKLADIERDWLQNWQDLEAGFDAKYLKTDFTSWVKGQGALHCLTKEIYRYTT